MLTYWINRPRIKISLSSTYPSMTISGKYMHEDIPEIQKQDISNCTLTVISVRASNLGRQPITINNIQGFKFDAKEWVSAENHPILSNDFITNGNHKLVNIPFASFVSFPIRLEGNDVKEFEVAFLDDFTNKDHNVTLKFSIPTGYMVASWKIQTSEEYAENRNYT